MDLDMDCLLPGFTQKRQDWNIPLSTLNQDLCNASFSKVDVAEYNNNKNITFFCFFGPTGPFVDTSHYHWLQIPNKGSYLFSQCSSVSVWLDLTFKHFTNNNKIVLCSPSACQCRSGSYGAAACDFSCDTPSVLSQCLLRAFVEIVDMLTEVDGNYWIMFLYPKHKPQTNMRDDDKRENKKQKMVLMD